MKLIFTLVIFVISTSIFAYTEKIEKWKDNNLISEQRAIDYIYDFAYDRFTGDDGETCEPEMDYAQLVEFKSEKEFVVEADLYITNISFWACRFLHYDQGNFKLKFKYNEEYKSFNVIEL